MSGKKSPSLVLGVHGADNGRGKDKQSYERRITEEDALDPPPTSKSDLLRGILAVSERTTYGLCMRRNEKGNCNWAVNEQGIVFCGSKEGCR